MAVFVEKTDVVTPSRKLRIRGKLRTKRIHFRKFHPAAASITFWPTPRFPLRGLLVVWWSILKCTNTGLIASLRTTLFLPFPTTVDGSFSGLVWISRLLSHKFWFYLEILRVEATAGTIFLSFGYLGSFREVMFSSNESCRGGR